MIVPDHWAEARKQHREGRRQITVRRFGWSTTSASDALAMAESRAEEALARILSGERLNRREPKRPYNGAFGVPIREEVLHRHGDEVITRNSYGAHCLNTPRALFADVDLSHPEDGRLAWRIFGISCLLAGLLAWQSRSWGMVLGLVVLCALAASRVASTVLRISRATRGDPEQIARSRFSEFLAQHPEWNLRIYKTPSGFRLLASHRPFDPSDTEVQEFFSAVGADPVYVRMCLNQHCFRARLTAKPWRIGIPAHMRPRPGVWPVAPERMPVRREWIARYEQAASGFAACRFLESLGSGVVHDDIGKVIELHDRESRALRPELEIA
ncbi:hypothetical protein [Ideonella sp. YS5]|uniref:hypothetical protein n=1 Tax=Ideonella sp. YS5 TaxID=3453714 RepID=UPI003EED4B21